MEKSKFFVCYRERAGVTKDYAKSFYKERKNKDYFKTHSSYKKAYDELQKGFYDDSDYIVVEKKGNKFISHRWYGKYYNKW